MQRCNKSYHWVTAGRRLADCWDGRILQAVEGHLQEEVLLSNEEHPRKTSSKASPHLLLCQGWRPCVKGIKLILPTYQSLFLSWLGISFKFMCWPFDRTPTQKKIQFAMEELKDFHNIHLPDRSHKISSSDVSNQASKTKSPPGSPKTSQNLTETVRWARGRRPPCWWGFVSLSPYIWGAYKTSSLWRMFLIGKSSWWLVGCHRQGFWQGGLDLGWRTGKSFPTLIFDRLW